MGTLLKALHEAVTESYCKCEFHLIIILSVGIPRLTCENRTEKSNLQLYLEISPENESSYPYLSCM